MVQKNLCFFFFKNIEASFHWCLWVKSYIVKNLNHSKSMLAKFGLWRVPLHGPTLWIALEGLVGVGAPKELENDAFGPWRTATWRFSSELPSLWVYGNSWYYAQLESPSPSSYAGQIGPMGHTVDAPRDNVQLLSRPGKAKVSTALGYWWQCGHLQTAQERKECSVANRMANQFGRPVVVESLRREQD